MIAYDLNYGSLRGGQRLGRGDVARVLKGVARVARVLGARSVSIAFVNATAMRRLNESYHGGRGVTDVLAFPADAISARDGYLGEVLIHYPRAKTQARLHGVSVHDEMRLLLVHGVLHLLGEDHDTPARAARMFRLQDRALALARS